MKKQTKKSLFIFIGFAFLFIRCQDDNPKKQIDPVVLKDYELVATKSHTEILSFVKGTGLPVPESEIKYDVDIYKVTYLTALKGSEVTASGLILLPKTSDPVGMISFQHGTISAHGEAPSETSASSSTMTFYAALATTGLIGVIPDLIGFGSSKNILHPYYVEKPTADAVLDNIKAARELALIKENSFNSRLFLAGYSQGGYATMAAHKAIETDGLENFTLIASFPASGGYDVKGVQNYFFAQTTYDQPFYIAYVARAYQIHYGWTSPLSDFFQAPFDSKIPSLFNGQLTGSQINVQLTNQISVLLSADILATIDTSSKYKYIVDAFNENSLTDWTPKTKMYMYHGDLDITVPYQNSVDVYNKFIASGASNQNVTFTTLPFATHSSGVTPYLIDLVGKVSSLK